VTVRAAAALGLAIGAIALRRDLAVRTIRALDRRGGLFTRRAQGVYGGAARIFGGLHRRVARDAAARIGNSRATVIDIGSGPGDLLAALRAIGVAAELIGVEPSAEMRALAAARRTPAVDGRAEHLPFADSSADLVLSTLSAHHWDDAVAAFAEIRRVLRPGGEARIYDVRFAGYGPEEARALAHRAGIDPDAVTYRVLDERLFGLQPYSLITLRP
jgi:ubiquinone/menaquinone biosynthesis C-methylase UbiE